MVYMTFMSYFVYILLNNLKTKTYVGYTNNLENRIKEHNSGESSYTRRFKPWKVVYTESFSTEQEALKKEKYYKSAAGRK